MSYSISQKDASYCISVTETGDSVSCWPTMEEAQAEMAKCNAKPGHDNTMTAGEIGSALDGGYCLFNEYKFVEPPEWMPLLPKPGKFKHPSYGEVNISRERNQRFVDNMNNQVYQHRIPVDAEHDIKGSGALGWITEARVNSDGTADGKVEWNERGKTLIRDNRFAFVSPEWWDEWTAPDTEVKHKDVLIGAGLVKRPFFKQGSLRPLLANESGIFAPHDSKADDQSVMLFDSFTTTKEKAMAEATVVTSAQFAELQTKFEDTQSKFAELSKTLAEAETARQAAEAQNKKFQEDLVKAQSTLMALETEKKMKRFHETAQPWAGDIASHMAVLDLLSASFGEESAQFKTYVQNQRAIAEQLAQGNLFSEHGRNRQGGGSASETLEALVIKAMGEHKLNRSDAQTMVFNANPQLYTAYARSVEQKI